MVEDIKEWLYGKIYGERLSHSLGAEVEAWKLAERFGIDKDRAALAALIHDNAKCLSSDKLLEIIQENNLDVSDLEKESEKTLHSPVGAFIAQKELGIDDPEILNAIRWHTVGRINMSTLEKIVFLADKIEPNTRDQAFREKILEKLDQTNNLDEAMLLCYDVTIRSLLDRRLVINTQTILVWNDLLQSLDK